jgi:hypothetical protein
MQKSMNESSAAIEMSLDTGRLFGSGEGRAIL